MKKPLPIAIDYTAAASHGPGVGRYGRELVRALVRREDCPQLLLFEWGRAPRLPEETLGLGGFEHCFRRVRVPGSIRWQALKARLTGRGMEHALGPVALIHRAHADRPVFGAKCPAPQVQPLLSLPADRKLEPAHMLVVGSEAGRRQVIDQLGTAPECVTAVTCGADHWLRDTESLDARSLGASGPPRLLALGAIEHRRKPLAVLAAFERLAVQNKDVLLHFEGRPGDAATAFEWTLAESPARHRVTWNPHPNDPALGQLIASSAVLVHLSAPELAPVTPLEALHMGTAVVASDSPGMAALIAPSARIDCASEEDAEQLCASLEAALRSAFDDGERTARRAVARPLTWDACAADHLKLWRQLGAFTQA